MQEEKKELNNNFCPRCCDFDLFITRINLGFKGKVCMKCRLKTREFNKEFKGKRTFKVKSRLITNYALRLGFIKKQPCEVCGEKKVDGHHNNYHKPLNITWLCRKHHLERHRELKLINKQNV